MAELTLDDVGKVVRWRFDQSSPIHDVKVIMGIIAPNGDTLFLYNSPGFTPQFKIMGEAIRAFVEGHR